MKTRACPSCHFIENYHHSNFHFALYDDCPLEQAGEIVSCNSCGLVYYSSKNVQENYENYYKNNTLYLRNASVGVGALQTESIKRYENISNILSKYLPLKNVCVADIGCGQGGLLKIFSDNGWTNLIGVDPLQAHAQSIQSTGAQYISGTLEKLSLPQCKGIILSHMLEHAYDIKKVLSILHFSLDEDGILYIEVPKLLDYPAKEIAPFSDFIHEHINHFSPSTLQNCLEYAGFKLEERGEQHLPNGCGGDWPLYGVFRKTTAFGKKAFTKEGREHISALQREYEKSTLVPLQKICNRASVLHIWGISSYGMHLIQKIQEITQKKCYLYDMSPVKQEKTIRNMPILHPNCLLHNWNENDRLIIPYSPYALEIQNQAKKMLTTTNTTIL